MPYQSLLVCLDGRKRAETTLELALRVAERFRSHLAAIYLSSAMMSVWVDLPAAAGAGAGWMPDEQALERDRQRASEFEAMFRRRIDAAGLSGGDWESRDDLPLARLTEAARYADLCVIGQADPNDPDCPYPTEFPGVIALGSGRPLLTVPFAGKFERLGERVVIAWNGSREAARAVHDALPLLRQAKRITVLSDGAPDPRLAAYLARHGVQFASERTDGAEVAATELILSRAADLGADLLIMGAYGHSRLRELMLGGVSRGILQHMTLPVLLSH
jgi:nucleotide-binding universal stress UspA family protein